MPESFIRVMSEQSKTGVALGLFLLKGDALKFAQDEANLFKWPMLVTDPLANIQTERVLPVVKAP